MFVHARGSQVFVHGVEGVWKAGEREGGGSCLGSRMEACLGILGRDNLLAEDTEERGSKASGFHRSSTSTQKCSLAIYFKHTA